MANPALVQYVASYSQRGYARNVIESSLLSQGYSKQDIKDAFKEAQHQHLIQDNQGHKLKVTHTEMILGLVMVVSVIIIIAVAVSIMPSESAAGQAPNSVTTQNPPRTNLDDVQSNSVQSDNIDQSDENQVIVPNDQNSPNTDTPIVQPTQPSTGVGQASLGASRQTRPSRLEIEQEVVELAKTDPQSATGLCPQIATESGENDCYAKIAIAAQKDEFCRFITIEKQLDFCYMQFAIQGIGSESICAEIQNTFRKESCIQLLVLNQELASTTATNTTEQQLQDSLTDNRFAGQAFQGLLNTIEST